MWLQGAPWPGLEAGKGKASGETKATGWAEGSSFLLPHDGGYSRTKAVIEPLFPVLPDGFIGRD